MVSKLAKRYPVLEALTSIVSREAPLKHVEEIGGKRLTSATVERVQSSFKFQLKSVGLDV